MLLRRTFCQSHSKQTVRLFHCQRAAHLRADAPFWCKGHRWLHVVTVVSHGVLWCFHRTLGKASLEWSENMLSTKEKLWVPFVCSKTLSQRWRNSRDSSSYQHFHFLGAFQEKPWKETDWSLIIKLRWKHCSLVDRSSWRSFSSGLERWRRAFSWCKQGHMA